LDGLITVRRDHVKGRRIRVIDEQDAVQVIYFMLNHASFEIDSPEAHRPSLTVKGFHRYLFRSLHDAAESGNRQASLLRLVLFSLHLQYFRVYQYLETITRIVDKQANGSRYLWGRQTDAMRRVHDVRHLRDKLTNRRIDHSHGLGGGKQHLIARLAVFHDAAIIKGDISYFSASDAADMDQENLGLFNARIVSR
jgi:hypothetical protein